MFRPTEELKTWTGDMSLEVASTMPNFRTHVLSNTSDKKILALHPIHSDYLKPLSRPELVELANKIAADIRAAQPNTPQAAANFALEETLRRLMELGVIKKKKTEQQQTPPPNEEGPEAVTTTMPKVEDQSHHMTNKAAEEVGFGGDGSEGTKANMTSPGPAAEQSTFPGSPPSILKKPLPRSDDRNQTALPSGPRALKDVNSPIKDKTLALSSYAYPSPKELAQEYRQNTLFRLEQERRNRFHPNDYLVSDHAMAQHRHPTPKHVRFAPDPSVREFDGAGAPKSAWKETPVVAFAPTQNEDRVVAVEANEEHDRALALALEARDDDSDDDDDGLPPPYNQIEDEDIASPTHNGSRSRQLGRQPQPSPSRQPPTPHTPCDTCAPCLTTKLNTLDLALSSLRHHAHPAARTAISKARRRLHRARHGDEHLLRRARRWTMKADELVMQAMQDAEEGGAYAGFDGDGYVEVGDADDDGGDEWEDDGEWEDVVMTEGPGSSR
ncbi:hypothetical protein PTNB73_06400 [Pyrenophora teres f. teres]|uniref:Uncharacterized protein n=2 Tax=Pyrenophora teres f. teres TaxID=97479 RepID=E3RT17_PYRTT|nr:hypothetical protein PTT_12120 [Pyrenophora teres f. teres 0-1]KAE8827944.1 hypothetical protein HRS9139_07163 [Pyrenophora teres f. teres]KAE8829633.1 hypothetical protein HRS9122_09448 [Pyrenophora teres f. teres]KAE8830540.1 hypothetical protein PTNB85_07127 [Pyrenophora teres f. teres]KAE8857459.1 hypothetical protein PTNB29_08526 [Pyrenophora teres f. teres]